MNSGYDVEWCPIAADFVAHSNTWWQFIAAAGRWSYFNQWNGSAEGYEIRFVHGIIYSPRLTRRVEVRQLRPLSAVTERSDMG